MRTCLTVTGVAFEARVFDRAWLEALMLAVLIGTTVWTAWAPGATWRGGITCSAKSLLEVAVVRLGASMPKAEEHH